MPAMLLSPVIYEELYGPLPKTVIILILVCCMFMLGRPLIHFAEKRLSFERLALFGFLVPFVIWVLLVIVKIILLE